MSMGTGKKGKDGNKERGLKEDQRASELERKQDYKSGAGKKMQIQACRLKPSAVSLRLMH